jgi:acyl-CoA synthetase (AMP-forming)/AMP-acid ligase II
VIGGGALEAARVLATAGVLRPVSPRTLAGMAAASRRYGRTLAGGVATAAVRHGDRPAITDELGTISYAELHRRSNALARALADRGVRPGRGLGLLARNHRYFVETVAAASKLGADVVLLNTGFSAPQLRDVLEREDVAALVHDGEFDEIAREAADGRPRVIAWPQRGADGEHVDELIAATDDADPPAPTEHGRQIVLTSGTTGTPKGARRPPTTPTDAVVGFLGAVPFRARRTHYVAAPTFHAWGFAHMGLALMLGGRVVLRRRFDPVDALQTIQRERPDILALVPVMAQRMLEVPEADRRRYDCSSVRVAAFGGSAIPGDLALRFMDAFGDVVYNTYGSTEVAVVSVAGPRDLRSSPATAGRPVSRVVVRLVDENGQEVPQGEPGRIFVGSSAAFEGYTGGGGKDVLDGLMSTGDVGRFDADGLLTIEGRDDDMIISGGENVFPREVEDVIAGLRGVREAAVVGVDDEQFGQRLRAYVVADDGATLGEDDVKQAVRAELARYKVPRDVVFRDELPRTTTGKILKRELSES